MAISNDWLKKKEQRHRLQFVKTHWRHLALIFVTALGGILANHSIVAPHESLRWFVGFLDGVILVGSSGGWWFIANEFDGGKNSRNGLFGEKQTVAALRRRSDWTLFHVGFDNIDADVVGVSEAGVFVFECKYTSWEWRIESPRLIGPAKDPIAQSQYVARKIRLLLLSYGIRTATTPVLVLWGPQLPRGADPVVHIDGVQVVMGAASKSWLNHLTGTPTDRETAEASIEALEHYTSRFQPRETTAA
jgi:hypothetical protein